MELEGKGCFVYKCLVLYDITGAEQVGTGREIEGFTVELEYRKLCREPGRVRRADPAPV